MKKNSLILAIFALVAVGAFLSGRISVKNSQEGEIAGQKEGVVVFNPEKQQNPGIKFFVMSFCPYGNQAEDILKPVAELLGSENVSWEPRYIVSKMTLDQIRQTCEPQIYSAARCADYVSQGYFVDTASCKERLFINVDECVSSQGKMVNGSIYTSLHGVGELNQNVREICAWNQQNDKSKWWDFVDRVNINCTSDNVDSCWQEQASAAGINIANINSCFENEYGALLDKEMAITKEYGVSSSPTFVINGEKFPPQDAYPKTESEVVELQIGKETFTTSQYRTPNAIKAAICAGFENPPAECEQVLQDTVEASAGGC
jgi:hypothetical protein